MIPLDPPLWLGPFDHHTQLGNSGGDHGIGIIEVSSWGSLRGSGIKHHGQRGGSGDQGSATKPLLALAQDGVELTGVDVAVLAAEELYLGELSDELFLLRLLREVPLEGDFGERERLVVGVGQARAQLAHDVGGDAERRLDGDACRRHAQKRGGAVEVRRKVGFQFSPELVALLVFQLVDDLARLVDERKRRKGVAVLRAEVGVAVLEEAGPLAREKLAGSLLGPLLGVGVEQRRLLRARAAAARKAVGSGITGISRGGAGDHARRSTNESERQGSGIRDHVT